MEKITKTFTPGTPLTAADLNMLRDKTNEIIDDIESGDAALYGNAWGVIINPNSANAALETVGNLALWTEFKENIGRYQLSASGKAIKLNVNDSSQYHDGTPVDPTKGDIMVHVPDLHYRVVTNANGTVTLWMSHQSIGGHAIHTSGEGNGSWIGAYLSNVSDGKLNSLPGVVVTRDRSISAFHALALAKGQDFGLSDYNQRKLTLMLYLSEYHNENSQAQLGNGMTGTGNNWNAVVSEAHTGDTATLGDSCGKVDFTAEGQLVSGACHVSLFGIEDPYGWMWEMIQGCYFGNSDNAAQDGTEMYLYEGNRMPSSAELTTQPAGDFRKLVRPTSSGNVYSLQMGEHFNILPARLGSGGWSDYHYANTTGQLLLWGGSANYGSACGLVCAASYHAFSASYSFIAARLAYYSVPVLVEREGEL